MRVAGLALQKTVTLTHGDVEGLVRALAKGVHPRDLVKRLYPGDRSTQRTAYTHLRSAIVNDPRVAAMLMEEARTELIVGLLPASRGLARRSANGNVPAIKLLLEATGVHNTKIKHEHSGEIKIKFDVPRPTFEGTVTDADVVED